MDVIALATQAFRAIGATEEKLLNREKLNNASDVQAAANRAKVQADDDKVSKAVQNEDLDEIQKRLAD